MFHANISMKHCLYKNWAFLILRSSHANISMEKYNYMAFVTTAEFPPPHTQIAR